MPELLLELFSEEIPARMQTQAAKDLERLVVGALSDRGLLFESVRSFAGPRRLTLAIGGLPAKQSDVSEEKKGPRVGAPEKAIEGFLKAAGITLDRCQKQSDAKGEFYVAVIARKGRATVDVLSEILPEAIQKMPWPKSMRWGDGSFRWVRPLHGIVATFDGEVVPFAINLSSPVYGGRTDSFPSPFAGEVAQRAGGGSVLRGGNFTWGHRFLSRGSIEVKRFEDYEQKLRANHVILDSAERREIILNDAKQKAFALGLELVEDEGLANEVAGLVEWPVVLIGTIDPKFMDLPAEILQTSMRTHQKYFALRASSFKTRPTGAPQDEAGANKSPRPEEARAGKFPHPEEARESRAVSKDEGRLANRFVVVANMVADDGGAAIVAGNERVLRARLSDAKFFWDQDRKRTLESRVADLTDIVFHAKLGTQLERVERIEALAGEIAKIIGADVEKAKRAARLCKADLTTGVVGEFPELQGVMGRYYALHDGESPEIADAIRDHYKPLGPNDAVPTAPVSIAVALADKLDTLVNFWEIDEKPTGSGDPFALRRSALGVVRIAVVNQRRFSLMPILDSASDRIQIRSGEIQQPRAPNQIAITGSAARLVHKKKWGREGRTFNSKIFDLLEFFAERLKIALREKGVRHDLIEAVFALGDEDDLVRLVRRVEALQAFLKTDDGANLLTGYRRAANILKIEEKKDKRDYRGVPDGLVQEEEQELQAALVRAKVETAKALAAEDFAGAMTALARLRAPVDRFFDKVTVNVPDKGLRENRLKLLSQIVGAAHQVADFSKVEG